MSFIMSCILDGGIARNVHPLYNTQIIARMVMQPSAITKLQQINYQYY